MSEFKTLKSITSKIGSGATPRGGSQVYQDNGISFIRSQNVQDMHFSKNGLVFLNNEQAEQLKGVTVKASDVLLNITGDSIARSCLVPDEMLPARVNQHVSIIRCKNSKDAEYVAYYLQFLKPYLLQICKVGGTRNALTKDAIENLKVNFLEDRHARGGLLASIDKKIELNNRINAELEAMAKTLYDYWFVQFDFPDDSPQGQGKPYKTSGGKMVYNPTLKREIPEGWSDGTLGEIAELYQPKTISEKEMDEDGEFLVYGANGIVGRYDQYNHEQSVVAVTCRGNSCGEINVTRPFSWITGNAMVVKTDSHFLPPTYIYNLLRSAGLENVITGSAQPQITRTNLAPMKIIKPAEKLLISFALLVKPSFEKRMVILDENEKLEKLRDWLLPMLMNGQVTVGEAS